MKYSECDDVVGECDVVVEFVFNEWKGWIFLELYVVVLCLLVFFVLVGIEEGLFILFWFNFCEVMIFLKMGVVVYVE